MTDPTPEEVEAVARAIATENGDTFESVPASKQEWTSERGQFGGRYRDINEPFQDEYLDMARAAIRALDELREKRDGR